MSRVKQIVSALILTICLSFSINPIGAAFGEDILLSGYETAAVYELTSVEGEAEESEYVMMIDHLGVSSGRFDLTGKLSAPGGGDQQLAYSGGLVRASFDNQPNMLLGEDCLGVYPLVRLVIDCDAHKVSVAIKDEASGNLLMADFSLRDNISLDCVAIDLADASKSLELYSLYDDAPTVNTKNSTPVSNTAIRPVASFTGSSNQLETNGVEQTGRAARSSYTGYAQLIDEINSTGSVKLSDYSSVIDVSAFKGGGWHHDNSWEFTPFGFSSYSISNGSVEYLTQVFLADISKTGAGSFSDGIGTVGTHLTYRGGFIASYNKQTDRLTAQFKNNGIRLSNVRVAVGGLTNKAIFLDLSGSLNTANGKSISAYIGIFNPDTAISSLFELLSGSGSSNESIYYSYEETYEQQLVRYGGKTIRTISVTSGSGYMNRYLSPQGDNHRISVWGLVKLYQGADTTWLHEWDCTLTHML